MVSVLASKMIDGAKPQRLNFSTSRPGTSFLCPIRLRRNAVCSPNCWLVSSVVRA